MNRHPFYYTFGFAVVNFAEACVILLTLGFWSPGWLLKYASSYAKRSIMRKARSNDQVQP